MDIPSLFAPNLVEAPNLHRLQEEGATRSLDANTRGVRVQIPALQIMDGLQAGFLGRGAANGVYIITSVVDGVGDQPITFQGHTYNNLSNGAMVPLGQEGDSTSVFTVYTRQRPVPDVLTFSLLVLRSNESLRELGGVIVDVLADARYKTLSQLVQTAMTAANPAFGILSQAAQQVMGLVGGYLKARPDDQLGYYQASYTNLFDNLGVGAHPPSGTIPVDKIRFRYQIDAA